MEDDQCFTIFLLDEEYQTDQVTLEIASVNIRSLTSDSGLVQQVRKKLYWMWIKLLLNIFSDYVESTELLSKIDQK